MFINFENVIEITQWLKKYKIDYQKQHIEARCPYCGDSRTKSNARRFHIDFYKPYDTFIFKCYRCGESGNIISLYSFLSGLSYKESEKILLNYKYDPEKALKKLSNKKEYKEEIEIDKDLDIDLKNECFDLNYIPKSKYEKNLIKKLKEFKKSRDVCDNFPLYIAHSGKYYHRIIIPVYVNNKLLYFQGRSIYEENLPKYLNPDVEKNKIILNIDKFDNNKYIIVTEGILDAISINNNQGTAVIGGYIDKNFLNILFNCTKKGVIICLDNPLIDNNSYNVLKKLINENINRYNDKLKFFITPSDYKAKDLNELLVKYKIKNMYDFVLQNSKSILYMKLLLSK